MTAQPAEQANAAREFKIGIWGTSQAGKTTYLAMLYHRFLSDPDWDVYRHEEDSERFVEEAFKRLFVDGKFPRKTIATKTYAYHITRKLSSPPQSFTLELLDAPGELYEHYYNRDRREEKPPIDDEERKPQAPDDTPLEIFAQLRACDGLLIFLDPAWSQQRGQRPPYNLLLHQIFEDLRAFRREQPQRTPAKVALCTVKVDGDDALWETRQGVDHAQCYRHHDRTDTETYQQAVDYCATHCKTFQQLGRHFMENWLPDLIDPAAVRCFNLSSIGRYVDPATNGSERINVGTISDWQRSTTPPPPTFDHAPAVTYPEPFDKDLEKDSKTGSFRPRSINQADKIAPFNLLDPIEWLLAKDDAD